MPHDRTLLAQIAALIAAAIAELLAPVVRQAVVDAVPAVVRRAALPQYLSKCELSKLTGWSERKIDYLRERGRLPYLKVGRSVLFATADVEHLLDEARVEARPASKNKGTEA